MRVLLRHSLGPDLHGRLSNLPITPDGCEEFIVSTRGNSESRNIGRLALILEDQGHFMKAEEKLRKAVNLLIMSRKCSPEAKHIGRLALALEDHSRDEDHSRYTDIEKESRQADTMFEMQQSPGPDDVAMFFCLNKLASLLCQRGQFRRAESYSRSCLSASIRISGRGSKSTLLSANNLALSMRHQGQPYDAYHLLWDALENADLNTSQNVAHVRLLDTLARLALGCKMTTLAKSLSCDVVRRSISLYGSKHPFTLTCISNLAATLAWTGHISGAEAMSRHALNGLEQSLGTDHPYCLRTARRVADYVRLQQRYPDASLRLQEILKMQEMRIGENHPDTYSTLRSLGAVYALQGYLKNSEVLFDQALEGQKQFFGLEHAKTLRTSRALDKVKEMQKKRPSVEEKAQRELLELLGPIIRESSEAYHRRFDYTSSPFQNSMEGHVLELVVRTDKERLTNILIESRVDTTTLGRALREAAAASQEISVRLLLSRDAPIDAKSAFHGSALQAASFSGSEAVVRLLLEKSSKVNLEGGIFGTALKAAILGQHTTIFGILLDHGLSEKVPPETLGSSMQLALLTGDSELISQLLEAGADINSKDNLFGSPLQQASFFGQEEIMAMLMDCKADIEMRAGIFGSPLQAAIQTQNESASERLRRAHDKRDDFGFDESKSRRATKLLLESHAESLPYTPPSSRVASWELTPYSPQTVEIPADLSLIPIKTYHRSDDITSTPSRRVKDTKSQSIAAIKRIMNFKRRNGEDSSTKHEPKKKRARIKKLLPSQPRVA